MSGAFLNDASKRLTPRWRRSAWQLLARLSQRRRLELLLAIGAALVLLHLLARGLQPKPELPRLLERAETLIALGLVDGGDEAPDAALSTRTPRWRAQTPEDRAPALLAPEFAATNADRAAGIHVHVLWIGELTQAPALVLAYVARGFNVTVHTSAARVLEGFAPHVHRAYERAIPRVAGFDLLKLLLLYKLGGLVVDADTAPVMDAADVALPAGCAVLLGKETHLAVGKFSAPTYRARGGATYGFNRPFQLLNWAMIAVETRNRHVEALIEGAMRHFLGLRDMEQDLVQDVAGSGLLSDYVALLHEQHGLDYAESFRDARVRPVEGLCMLDDELRSRWIQHAHMASWHLRK